jgi:hypothetical protein
MLEVPVLVITVVLAVKGVAGSTLIMTLAIGSAPAAFAALIMGPLAGQEVTSIRCDAASIAISGTWGLNRVSPVSELKQVTIVHIRLLQSEPPDRDPGGPAYPHWSERPGADLDRWARRICARAAGDGGRSP